MCMVLNKQNKISRITFPCCQGACNTTPGKEYLTSKWARSRDQPHEFTELQNSLSTSFTVTTVKEIKIILHCIQLPPLKKSPKA